MECTARVMSKRIVMWVLSSVAMSIGGFFVSCGAGDTAEPNTVVVQVPQGCTLVSPRSPLEMLQAAGAIATVKPGKNEFVLNCDGQLVQVDKQVNEGQHVVTIEDDEVR